MGWGLRNRAGWSVNQPSSKADVPPAGASWFSVGRTHARIAVLLLLVPSVVDVLVGAAGLVGDAGARVAAGALLVPVAIWAGLLYLVYLGFRLVRWLVSVLAVVGVVFGLASLIKSSASITALEMLVEVTLTLGVAAGTVILVASRPAHRFFRYQRGELLGTEPE